MSSAASDWVSLSPRFTPGWPWPEDSYGMDPLFGSDGWCHDCGTPLREQTGALIIQGSKFPKADVWMPNWMFDVVCVSIDVATEVQARFAVALRDVHKPRTGPTGVKQLLPEPSVDNWYRPEELATAVRARHHQHHGDDTGTTCDACGLWKWLPIDPGEALVDPTALGVESDVIASPEVFGAGGSSFRHLLFRRSLADVLLTASPRNWDLVEIHAP